MSRGAALVLALGLALGAAPAAAGGPDRSGDPCEDAVADPAATPVREGALDAQRGACPRTELAAAVTGHVLIDTPGFRGLLGGDLALGGRVALRGRLELGARLRIVDYVFAQTGVNMVSEAGLGPLAVSAAYAVPLSPGARAALIASTEVPYTRDDTATVRAGGQLTAAVTGRLAARWVLHARLGAIAAVASSLGGETHRLALRAGADLGWRVHRAVALAAGADMQAGWYGGLDAVIARASVQVRPRGGAWRLLLGAGLPLGGDDGTNAVVTLGTARDLD